MRRRQRRGNPTHFPGRAPRAGLLDSALGLLAVSQTDDIRRLSGLRKRQRRLRRLLTPVEPHAAIGRLAGLLTYPNHHTATPRLEALIHLAAMDCRGVRAPTDDDVRKWLAAIDSDPIRRTEDPPEDAFVVNIYVGAENLLLFQGEACSIGDSVQDCLLALKTIGSEWSRALQTSVLSLLRLGNAVARRSRLSRNTEGGGVHWADLRPADGVLREAPSRITFHRSVLNNLQIEEDDLIPFLFDSDVKHQTLTEETIGHTTLERRPLLRAGDSFVVALPTAIGLAVLRHIAERVADGGHDEQFKAALVDHHLRSLATTERQWKTHPQPFSTSTSVCAEIVQSFSVGSFVHILYCEDSHQEFAAQGLRSVHDLEDGISKRIQSVRRQLTTRSDFRRGLTVVLHGGLGRPFVVRGAEPMDGWHFLQLPIADYLLLSWHPELDMARAWKLLEHKNLLERNGLCFSNLGGFLNLFGYAKERQFDLSLHEMSADTALINSDFAAAVRVGLRVALDRHVVRGPEGLPPVVLQGRDLSVDPTPHPTDRVYVSLEHAERGRLMHYFDRDGRGYWVLCSSPIGDATLREMLHAVVETVVRLLEGLSAFMDKASLSLSSGAIAISVTFPDIAQFDHQTPADSSETEGPELSVDGQTVRIACSNEFLKQFILPTNAGDRSLLQVLISGLYRFVHGRAPRAAEVKRLFAAVLPSDQVRSFHMFEVVSAADTVRSVVRQPEPRFIWAGDRAMARVQVVGEHPPGAVRPTEAESVLKAAVETVWRRIETHLHLFERGSVVDGAIANLEAIETDRWQRRRTAASTLAVQDDEQAIVDGAVSRQRVQDDAALASRVLIEMAVCVAPFGVGRVFGSMDLDYLLAQIALLVELGARDDACHYGVSYPDLRVTTAMALDFGDPESVDIQGYFLDHAKARFEADATSGRDDRSEHSLVISDDFRNAFLQEFGLSVEAYARFTQWMTDEAVRRKRVSFRETQDQVLARLAELNVAKPAGALAALTLVSRQKWNEEASAKAKPYDWYPWRYGRRLSILRRPLIQLTTEANSVMLLYPAGAERLFLYIWETLSGHLPMTLFDSREMRALIGEAANRLGHDLNVRVATKCRTLGWKVMSEKPMTAFGGQSVLGDIDVLAWDFESSTVWIIECKRLRSDRTVGEIGKRIREFTMEEHNGKLTSLGRHVRRVRFLRANPNRLSAATGIDASALRLRSALATDGSTPLQYSEAVRKAVDVVTDVDGLDRDLGSPRTEG